MSLKMVAMPDKSLAHLYEMGFGKILSWPLTANWEEHQSRAIAPESAGPVGPPP